MIQKLLFCKCSGIGVNAYYYSTCAQTIDSLNHTHTKYKRGDIAVGDKIVKVYSWLKDS